MILGCGLSVNVDAPHIYGAEAVLSVEQATQIIAAFESLVLPVFRRPQGGGIDGTAYGAILGNYW